MTTQAQINEYLASLPATKQSDIKELDRAIREVMPKAKLWYLDGRNDQGKVVTNPNIGYGQYTITYADGRTREFYQIGLSANTSGISVYIMGLDDKTYLPTNYGKTLGKATVTGYCIKFKSLKDIKLDVLQDAIRDGVAATSASPA